VRALKKLISHFYIVDLFVRTRESLKREAEVMSYLNHRNIIRTIAVIENRINVRPPSPNAPFSPFFSVVKHFDFAVVMSHNGIRGGR